MKTWMVVILTGVLTWVGVSVVGGIALYQQNMQHEEQLLDAYDVGWNDGLEEACQIFNGNNPDCYIP